LDLGSERIILLACAQQCFKRNYSADSDGFWCILNFSRCHWSFYFASCLIKTLLFYIYACCLLTVLFV